MRVDLGGTGPSHEGCECFPGGVSLSSSGLPEGAPPERLVPRSPRHLLLTERSVFPKNSLLLKPNHCEGLVQNHGLWGCGASDRTRLPGPEEQSPGCCQGSETRCGRTVATPHTFVRTLRTFDSVEPAGTGSQRAQRASLGTL